MNSVDPSGLMSLGDWWDGIRVGAGGHDYNADPNKSPCPPSGDGDDALQIADEVNRGHQEMAERGLKLLNTGANIALGALPIGDAAGLAGAGEEAAGEAGAVGAAERGAIPSDRTSAENLAEKLTMDEAKAGAGELIMDASKIKDPLYAGGDWVKMQYVHRVPDELNRPGYNVVVHYMKNIVTGATDQFKFK